jgi:hypothetical protein
MNELRIEYASVVSRRSVEDIPHRIGMAVAPTSRPSYTFPRVGTNRHSVSSSHVNHHIG